MTLLRALAVIAVLLVAGLMIAFTLEYLFEGTIYKTKG